MIEKMIDFFSARVEEYEKHMINNVVGCKEGYTKMVALIPATATTLLDLGCGTGLELDAIFKIYPDINVTGIDITQDMLEVLRLKHPDKKLTLINANFFDYAFGTEMYDVIVSFQAMHHFSHNQKIRLYSKVYSALVPGGKYIESDYMVTDQNLEDYYFCENERIRKENNIDGNELYHYDTPCTVINQLRMFKTAGFKHSEMIWREENTTIIVAEKGITKEDI